MQSYYEALPIFRAAMDAAVRVDAALQRFPKGHKHLLGSTNEHGVIERILRAGHPVAVALERSEPSGNVKRREFAYLFEHVTLSNSELEE